ncbi:protein abrupt-like [Vespa crabro]|uniref:protein abrupt-like n=1 Tax=Vespa crabro TaxID=7445 RepID=UPI001F01D215|nr:protein abrupt-like [Vespa crabro]
MSSQICLKWNSFLNNIATSFESLWEEEGLVDVTLASDGQCLTAHKVILSASSPFFKKVFQKNLPALLKAAETLQIRGLSGGDIFAKDQYKRLAELEQAVAEEDIPVVKEEAPKKKQKICKQHNNSILEKALTPRISQSENTSESNESEQSGKDTDHGSSDALSNPVFHRLEMKIEPLEMMPEDLQKRTSTDKDPVERLDTGQVDGMQGSGNSPAEDISGISGLSGLTGFSDVKPLLYSYQQLPYADLLPSPDIISTWASSRPMDHLACDLMKILFTPEERILCNVNGKMGKQQFDSNKIHLIREVLLHFSGIAPNSIEWEEVWKNCVTKIDTRSSKPAVTIIAEAQESSSFRVSERIPEESRGRKGSKDGKDGSLWSTVQNQGESGLLELERPPKEEATIEATTETTTDTSSCFSLEHVAGGGSRSSFSPAFPSSSGSEFSEETVKGGPAYPPFPCPFCDRAYTSWGFRRRHIKAVHTVSPSLHCKWCLQVLPTHAAWRRHVISAHNLSANDAHNGLLILEEAHMVLQIARPTRLDTLVNIIKQSSQQNDNSQLEKD